MSLYHAYRPQTFADIVGQDHVKQTLAAAVARGDVAHAYLFSGPRGIGKTSIARILAMAVNCSHREQTGKASPHASRLTPHQSAEPCGECTSCIAIKDGSDLNVIEIDAASNRGIDEIRQLKESIGFAPSTMFGEAAAHPVRKVYIIDEVHMLTKEAFNALLKTLEEPPVHAMFILATTELHRVPDTIISRTQHFSFKRATVADTEKHLQMIATKEGLALSPEATALVALHADGAFRDALSLLDQMAALGEKEITAEHVRLLLGIAPEAGLLDLLTATFAGNPTAVHDVLERFATQGYDPSALVDALITTLRHLLWASYGLSSEGSELLAAFAAKQAKEQSPARFVVLIERLIIAKQQLRWSPLPMLPLELALLPTPETRNTNTEARNNIEIRTTKIETQITKAKTTLQPDIPSSVEESSTQQSVAKNPPQPSLIKGGSTKSVTIPLVAKEGQGEISSAVPNTEPDPSISGSAEAASDAQDDTDKEVSPLRSRATEGQGSRLTPPEASIEAGKLEESGAVVDPSPLTPHPSPAIDNLDGLWTKVLTKVRPKNAQLAALLKSSRLVSVDSDECTIEVPFSFYADRIKDRKNSTIIIEAFAAEASIEATIRCVVAGTAGEALGVRSKVPGNSLTPDSSPLTSRTQDELAKDVLEVFGSASTVENAPAEVTSG